MWCWYLFSMCAAGHHLMNSLAEPAVSFNMTSTQIEFEDVSLRTVQVLSIGKSINRLWLHQDWLIYYSNKQAIVCLEYILNLGTGSDLVLFLNCNVLNISDKDRRLLVHLGVRQPIYSIYININCFLHTLIWQMRSVILHFSHINTYCTQINLT